MANTRQSKKRALQNKNRFAINKARRSRIRTFLRKVEEAIASGDKDAAQAALRSAQPEVMRGVTKGVFHKNTASRKISRLSARVKSLGDIPRTLRRLATDSQGSGRDGGGHMQQRRIGGAEVSALGYGAMSFAEFYGPTTEDNSFAIMEACLAAGVTHLDTSNVYGMGRSERAIGQFLKDHPGTRDRFHIATKAGITRDAEGNRRFDNSAAHLEAELDKSLERMGIDCVDLFYVHRREAARPIEEVAEALGGLVARGKIRAIGFSEIAPASLRRAHAVHPVAAVQSEYSLATRFPDLGLVQTCAELGVALVAFSPVARSMLTDDPLDPEVIPSLPFLKTNPRFMEPNYQRNLELTAGFRALASEMGVPAAGLAIAWCLARGPHVIPIPGTRSVAHFRELVAGAELDLAAEDLARIEAVLPVGWAHGDRYSDDQWVGPERYC